MLLQKWFSAECNALQPPHRINGLCITPEQTYQLKVRRKQDALHQFMHKILPTHYIRVTVDAGGPLREFFCLLLAETAKNNSLFCGEYSSRVPCHNMLELSKKTYKCVGIMLAASIIHGGPAPRFFAHCVADYIVYGIDGAKGRVPNLEIKNKLMKVAKYI